FLGAPRPQPSPRFPYTTLFRSYGAASDDRDLPRPRDLFLRAGFQSVRGRPPRHPGPPDGGALTRSRWPWPLSACSVSDDRKLRRSEEHTSELQSRENLVCRLLL